MLRSQKKNELLKKTTKYSKHKTNRKKKTWKAQTMFDKPGRIGHKEIRSKKMVGSCTIK